jgi:hypothetical protein
MAVATVLLLTVAGFALATATVIGSISTQRGTVRDQDTKAALAAADSAAYTALLRENKVLTTSTLPCLLTGALGGLVPGLPSADGWCAAQTGAVGDATWSYRIKPVNLIYVLGQQRREIKIVATGVQDGVTRRVAVTASTLTGVDILGDERAIGLDWINVGTGNGKGIFVDSGTNGNFTATNASEVCGDVRHGVGHQFIGQEHLCSGYYVTEGNKDLAIPDLAPVRASNDNIRLSNGQDPKSGNVSWDPTTKTLDMQGNSSVTLGGSSYLFCKLSMRGKSSLIMAKGSAVKIYFDSPANCGQASPATQVDISGNSNIVASGWNPSAGVFELPGIYMLGSETDVCNVDMTGSAKTNEFVLYAPRCNVKLWGSSDYYGAVGAKTLDIGGSARLLSDQNLPNPDINAILTYRIDRYVECGATPTTPPDLGC